MAKSSSLSVNSHRIWKNNFSKLPQETHLSIILTLIHHASSEPESLKILNSLYSEPNKYFNNDKSLLSIVLNRCYFLSTKNIESNFIKTLDYLLDNNIINCNSLPENLDTYIMSLINSGHKDVINYLLRHKTNQESTFIKLLTAKSIDSKYSLIDFCSNSSSPILSKYLIEQKIEIKTIKDSVREGIKKGLESLKTENLKDCKEKLEEENKTNEIIYNLFSFKNSYNIEEFIRNFSSAIEYQKDLDESSINFIYTIFEEVFFNDCTISQRIKFLEATIKIDPEYIESMLKIQKTLSQLIETNIIDSEDFSAQQKIAHLLSEYGGLTTAINFLYSAARKADKVETLFRIITEHSNKASSQVKAFIDSELVVELLKSPKANSKELAVLTERAVSLVEDEQFFNTTEVNKSKLLELQKNIYYNRSEFLLAMQDPLFALYSIKYLKSLSYEEREEKSKETLDIWEAFMSLKIEQKYTNELFILLAAPGKMPLGEKMLYDMAFELLYDQDLKSQINSITTLRDGLNDYVIANKIDKPLWMKAYQTIALNIANGLSQPMLTTTILFISSDIDTSQLTYEDGIKKFFQNKDGKPLNENSMTMLLQGLFFFIKHKDFNIAEKLLEVATEKYKKITCTLSNETFSEIYLFLALNLIELKVNSAEANTHQARIEKLLISAQNFDKSLDIVLYQQKLADLFNKEEPKDYSKFEDNSEFQEWIQIGNIVDDNPELQDWIQIDDVVTNPETQQRADNAAKKHAKAFDRLYEQKIHALSAKFKIKSDLGKSKFSWCIEGRKYSTEDEGVVDLGNKRYCVISNKLLKKLDSFKEDLYTKALEKKLVTKAHGQSGVKTVGSSEFLEIKTTQEERLHNNHIWYENEQGYFFTIFVKK